MGSDKSHNRKAIFAAKHSSGGEGMLKAENPVLLKDRSTLASQTWRLNPTPPPPAHPGSENSLSPLPTLTSHIFERIQRCCCCCSVAQSCLTLCNSMDCSAPGSSVHRISLARDLEWAAISSFRGYSRHRDRTRVSDMGRRILYH